jgi:hypothetical protein
VLYSSKALCKKVPPERLGAGAEGLVEVGHVFDVWVEALGVVVAPLGFDVAEDGVWDITLARSVELGAGGGGRAEVGMPAGLVLGEWRAA